ncbi:MAG: LacI family DNA-binding transcriptional regulator [Cellulosilyticum sp.]|nr:LacI family DNA-binding transcriptional regulator [Cellulosilyticum sp.]
MVKVTINDVAREAGVSKSTVSRVLSNHDRISDETKEKVNEVIKRLEYQPNITARNLAKNQTRTLGVVLPIDASDYFGNPIYIQMMQGMSLFAQEHDYFIMYAFGKTQDEEKCIKEFSNGGIVDGIIMLKTEVNDQTIKYLSKIKFPFVTIGKPNEEGTGLWVDNDNMGTTYDLVEQLVRDGHKKIALISAKENWMVSKERLEGYKKALLKHKIAYRADLVYHGEAFTQDVGYKGIEQICKKEIPTAIIGIDDLIAVGINRYLNNVNMQEKIIIGFNNTALATYQTPSFSSVEIQGLRLGYEAAKLLVDYLQDKVAYNYHKIIESKLIKRGNYK